ELMAGSILECIDDRFVPHLVVHPAYDQCILHPDTGCGVMEPCIHNGIIEIDLFSVRMKDIQSTTICKMLICTGHCGKQKLVKLFTLQCVIHDLHACAA